MFKNKVLNQPLVNIYTSHIEEVLLKQYPQLEIQKPSYSFINSIDIDNAFAYVGKGAFRTFGGFIKDIVSLSFKEAWYRFQCILGLKKDPFQTFDYVLSLQEQYGFKTIYFALFARLAQYDRSLSMHSPRLHKYIKDINDFCEVGIHPSYQSNDDVKIVESE